MNENNNQNQQPKRKFNWANIAVILVALAFVAAMAFALRGCSAKSTEKSYSDAYTMFITNSADYDLTESKIEATPSNDSAPSGSYLVQVTIVDATTKEKAKFYFYATAQQYENFISNARLKGYKITYKPGSTVNIGSIIMYAALIHLDYVYVLEDVVE